MTNTMKTFLKQEAKRGLKENGIKVFQKDLVLLECSYSYKELFGSKILVADYVMVKDRKTGRQYQVRYGAKYYNADLDTLYSVNEYIA